MSESPLSMRGRVCMITGANSGIGKATALGLAKLGATVVMVCLDRARGESALKEISQGSGNTSISLFVADLASQKSVRLLAKEFTDTNPKLHVLINNAGVLQTKRILTEDNIETTFAVNYLAHFLLTNLLLETLEASAPSRIVTLSSNLHQGAQINFEDLQGEKHFSGFGAYHQSKLANILFTYELSKRLQGTRVTANCLHPGAIRTNLGRHQKSILFRAGYRFVSLFFSSPTKGAQTVIYLASSPDVEYVTGKYFVNKKEKKSSPESNDEAAAQKLWQISAKLTGISS
jgi:NAD(P)-dependent dehydrogenase (short-subunit alcohol dehydrogenase family)